MTGPTAQPTGSPPVSVPRSWTTSTGSSEWLSTKCETEPSTAERTAPRPREPITIRSWSAAAARFSSSGPGWPADRARRDRHAVRHQRLALGGDVLGGLQQVGFGDRRDVGPGPDVQRCSDRQQRQACVLRPGDVDGLGQRALRMLRAVPGHQDAAKHSSLLSRDRTVDRQCVNVRESPQFARALSRTGVRCEVRWRDGGVRRDSVQKVRPQRRSTTTKGV